MYSLLELRSCVTLSLVSPDRVTPLTLSKISPECNLPSLPTREPSLIDSILNTPSPINNNNCCCCCCCCCCLFNLTYHELALSQCLLSLLRYEAYSLSYSPILLNFSQFETNIPYHGYLATKIGIRTVCLRVNK